MILTSPQLVKGDVFGLIEENGSIREIEFHNTVLNDGKAALVRSLTGDIGTSFDSYICKMVFGTNGTVGDVPRFVDATRNALFGPAVISKNVMATIDPANPTQALFSAVLLYDDAVGYSLNEMGLQMADETFYSIATFGNITKTSQMQITWSWRISFL